MKKVTENQGDGITARKTYRTKYEFGSAEENEALINDLKIMHEKIKQPWRGKKDWVEKIRSQAGDLESKAPKWEDDPEKHNEYFAARKTDAWYFREMARLTHQIESEIKGSLGWDAVSSALQLGELITELRFKTDLDLLHADEQIQCHL